ncbi:hypothetical protein ABE237_15975 [Brevibacillus formosus]|uniref:hypothetical protein n=1 Tax=Brevibacillus TaxID=55080 RepID=UPI0018CF42DE|nr:MULTISPECIES: hypothetical protein [Brevibacillus]MBG9943943.1 hypothetical protein [Brevibacillus formosus]MCM3143879.1 hypothetical protein [Brevibacillus sp. MER 51]
MSFLETFQHRLGLTVFTLVSLFVGAFTQYYYQVVTAPTLTSFINVIIKSKNNDELLLTWGLNLLSGVLLGSAGFLWAKETVVGNFYYDTSEVSARIVCAVLGILCLGYAAYFISFIFTSLLGIVIATAIVGFFLWSNNRK